MPVEAVKQEPAVQKAFKERLKHEHTPTNFNERTAAINAALKEGKQLSSRRAPNLTEKNEAERGIDDTQR